jgi:hypothetical protein
MRPKVDKKIRTECIIGFSRIERYLKKWAVEHWEVLEKWSWMDQII